MYSCLRPYAAGLAAASSGILTLSLVTAPPDTGVAVSHAEVRAVQLAALTAADISTAVATIPLEIAPVAKLPGLISSVTRSTTTPVIQPATATQIVTTSTAATDLTAASPVDNLVRLVANAIIIAGEVTLAGLSVVLVAGAFTWNAFANLVNPVLDAIGQPPLPKLPLCFFGGRNCGSTAAAQSQLASQSQLAAPADIAASPTDSLNVPTVPEGVATTDGRVAGATEHPTSSVGRRDKGANSASAPVRAARTIPSHKKSAAVSPSKKNDTTATTVGSDENTAASSSASGVGSGKRAKKPAAHSPVGHSVGSGSKKR